MEKVLTIDQEKCTSCRLCELACSARQYGQFRPTASHVQVAIFPEDAVYFPVVCMQCEDAPCMQVCPSGALVRNSQSGAVDVVDERCVGCRICSLACPFGVISYVGGKARKCDLCKGEPECVAFCPTGALRFEPQSRADAAVRASFAQRLKQAVKEVKVS
jgi:carbon-monoxide dehydrogenase iron sulfur subunit